MQQIKTANDLKLLGTILGIWAHPDDETFSMGGLMSAAVQNGQRVICITATRGEAGVQDETRWPAATLGVTRTNELKTAMQILGVTEHCWMDYPDGGCKNVDQQEAISKVAECIRKYNPDTILTFGPDGMTGHADHQTVSEWSTRARILAESNATIYHVIQTIEQEEAMAEADKELDIFFNIDKPPVLETCDCAICFELDDDLFALKIAALKAMPSQTETMIQKYEKSLRVGLGREAFVFYNSTKN